MQIIKLELDLDGLILVAEGLYGAYEKGYETLLLDVYDSLGESYDLWNLQNVCLNLNLAAQEAYPENPPVFGKIQLEKSDWKRSVILTYIWEPDGFEESDQLGCAHCNLPAGCDECRSETD